LNLIDSQNTPQETWDLLKPLVRTIAQKHGRRRSEWRQRVLKRLQRKRNKFLRAYKQTGI
jgi:hypothetical protein